MNERSVKNLVAEISIYIPELSTTNNEAEYIGLIESLRCVLNMTQPHGVLEHIVGTIEGIEVYGDSKLIINQIKGVFKANHEVMAQLKTEVLDLVEDIKGSLTKNIEFFHVLRGLNKDADALANRAMDEKLSKVSVFPVTRIIVS